MPASTFLKPVPAPSKTKRFWLLVALGLLIPLFAPLWMIFLGMPPFPLRIQLTSGTITFAVWIVLVWFALRFGVIAWSIIGILFFAFGLFARLHS
ncbi:MAG TPA: hypothetical protein VK581_01120 [Chthoniobacterales bacterium]|nr:hypothetical protein [Chthoniobacterales bacterium]